MSRRDRMLKAIQNADGKFWDVKAMVNETGGKIGEVYIYGYITGTKWFDDDVAPKALKDEIDALGDIETLYVRINSPGGSVFAGNAIYNILRRVDAEVVATIDGLAASAASVIAMAADKVIVPKNGVLMIHDAWTFAIGNAKEIRKAADVLDTIQKGYVAVYKEKTGLSEDEIKTMLAEETWMDAETAKKNGFVDQIDESQEVAASLEGDKLVVNGQEFDTSIFGVLPPFEGVEGREAPSGERERRRERPAAASIKSAWNVVAKALGFDGEARGGIVPDEPAAIADPTQAQGLADAILKGPAASDETKPEDTKGSGEMSELKTPQAAQEPTPQATPAPAVDIKNMDPEAIAARLADLEARAQAAEDLARQERDKRVEAEFVKRVEGYGTLPISAAELGPIMKAASESLSEEHFAKLESVLKAAGAGLEDSALFKAVGTDGDGDNSASGQYKAALAKVKEANPQMSDAEASIEAFKNLPEAVQEKVSALSVLPA